MRGVDVATLPIVQHCVFR